MGCLQFLLDARAVSSPFFAHRRPQQPPGGWGGCIGNQRPEPRPAARRSCEAAPSRL